MWAAFCWSLVESKHIPPKYEEPKLQKRRWAVHGTNKNKWQMRPMIVFAAGISMCQAEEEVSPPQCDTTGGDLEGKWNGSAALWARHRTYEKHSAPRPKPVSPASGIYTLLSWILICFLPPASHGGHDGVVSAAFSRSPTDIFAVWAEKCERSMSVWSCDNGWRSKLFTSAFQ